MKSPSSAARRLFSAMFLASVAGCASVPTSTTVGADGAVTHRPITLWSFLAVDQIIEHEREKHHRVLATLGQHFPELEPNPPLVLNTSPEAAQSSSVAIQNTAHVLAAEQQAPQKIKALKAVAQVGAAGYPQVEEALLAGLDDRSPKVRLATVQAILKTAGDRCEPCEEAGNCTPDIRRTLWRLGYGVHENGCPLEPSAPVRRVARLTLDACGGPYPEPCPPPHSAELPLPKVIEEALGTPVPAELPPPAPQLAEPVPSDG